MTPKHTLPSSVRAIVTCHGVPVARLFVKVRVGASFKNDFWSAFGPTDSDGSISFSRDDLLRNGELDRSLFVMDYGHPEIDYTGRMEVRAMGREAIHLALDAYHRLQQVVPYPAQFAEQLKDAHLVLESLAPARLEVELSVSGGSGEVVSASAEA